MCMYVELTKIIWKHHPLPKPKIKPKTCRIKILELLEDGPKTLKEIHKNIDNSKGVINTMLQNLQGGRGYIKKIEYLDNRYQLLPIDKLGLRYRVLSLLREPKKSIEVVRILSDEKPEKIRNMISKLNGSGGIEKVIKRLKNGYYVKI